MKLSSTVSSLQSTAKSMPFSDSRETKLREETFQTPIRGESIIVQN